MPVKKKIMRKLKEEYGEDKGVEVYYAMVNKGKIKEMKKGSASGRKKK